MVPRYFSKLGQILFPEAKQLADLVLFGMGLETSVDQSIIRMGAESKAVYSLMEGDMDSERDASFEAKIYNNIDPVADLELLCLKEKEKVVSALKIITLRHDEYLRELMTRFPLLSERMWQTFRRTLLIDNSIAYCALNGSSEEYRELRELLAKKLNFITAQVQKTDQDYAAEYLSSPLFQDLKIDEQLKSAPGFRFVEYDKDYMLGIGRYAFARANGDIVQTIWDIRQENLQFFNKNS